jgi:hypothetical protein
VDSDAAGGLGLAGLGRVDDGDVLGATALRVLDSGTLAAARAAGLAGRSIGHGVVELQVAVELGSDADVGQREGVVVAAGAAKRRRAALVRRARTADAATAGSAAVKALSVRLAAEAGPLEVLVVAKAVANGGIVEVIATRLRRRADVVGVVGARVRATASPAL